ncbi:MAG: AsmA family protein, partial [Rhodospirillales bacterium]|nr:AsmA family protein [Rhodospirillales bacterium]
MRLLKVIGFALAGLVVLAGIGVAALVWGGGRAIASLVEGRGSAILGREIRIGGAFDIAWGDPIRIVAEDVHVANASWGSAPEMFSARRLELALALRPLLHLRYVVPLLALDGASLVLETSEKGEGNWQFFAAKTAAPEERTEFPDLHRLAVAHSAFLWRNNATGATTEVDFRSLSLDAPDRTGPVRIVSEGDFQKKPYKLDATVGALAELQTPAQPYPVKLAGEVGGTKVEIDGTVAEPLSFQGVHSRISLEGEDLRRFLEVFSVPVPATPRFRIAGRLEHQGDAWSGHDVEVKLGKSEFGGGVVIDVAGQRPYVKAELVAKYLDLADFKGFTGEEPAKPPAKKEEDTAKRKQGGRVIPETPLPTEQLGAIDADLSIDAAVIKPSGGVPFERLTLVLALEDRDLYLKPLRFGMANGEVAADLHWNARSKPGTLEGSIDLRRFDLGKFFGGLDVPKQLKETKGVVGGFLKLRSTGDDERAVAANADGELGFFMEKGQFSQLLTELLGIDVAETFGFLMAGDKPNPVNCLASHFALAEGVATASTFILDTNDTVVEARGNINLGSETLFLDVTPYPKDWSPLSARSPIEVRGTFGA